MGTQVNTENDVKGFSAGYGMLPAIFQSKAREEIIARCGWASIVTFYNKCRGDTLLRPPEADVVELVFAKYNIDPWTGVRTD